MRRMFMILGAGVAAAALLAAGGWIAATRFVEKPAYTVVRAAAPFELRDYPPMNLAEIAVEGPRREALGAGFRPLARYIFASDREGPTIAMTAPVVQRRAAGEGEAGWVVGFVMPAEHDLAALPAPSGEAVRLRAAPAARVAAVRFSGVATDAALAERESSLRGWIAAEGLVARGEAVFAYYDDPFTPGFLRRNEVLIALGSPLR